MRKKTALATAAVAGSLSLIAGMTAHQAGAFTSKELKVCWESPGTAKLPVVVSGPERGSRLLADGACKAWDVVPGVYTISINASAIEVLFDSGAAGRTAVCGKADVTGYALSSSNKRLQNYSTVGLADDGGSFNLKVTKNRLTRALVKLSCT